MANAFINLMRRILPSGLFVNRRRQYQQEYLRDRSNYSYWQSNSIYLDNIYNKIATDVAMMRFKHLVIIRRDDAPDLWQWLEQDEIANVLSFSPNEDEPPLVFWSNVARSIVQNGVAVVVPTYENDKLARAELAANVSKSSKGKIIVQIAEEAHELKKSDVWIFENPKKNLTAQLGQISKLIDDNLHALSVKINEQPNSKIRGFIEVPTTIDDPHTLRMAESRLENMFAAAEKGGISYLQRGEKFQELTGTYSTADPEELEFLKSQLYQAFGINEKLFTCDYNEDQYRAYYQSVLKVYLRLIQEELNRKLFTAKDRAKGHRVMAYYDMVDITSLANLSEFAFKARYAALMNSNEVRENYLGLPPYDGGDAYETNLNAVRVDGGIT